jgi:hypothetical protein
MNEQKTLEELLTLTRPEQNAYLATLSDDEAKELARKIFKATSDRHMQQMIDSLNSHANDEP